VKNRVARLFWNMV